ncbi:MAG TPA: FeoA family protein [Polyangiaceae bacterium]|jgi:Fe2+ transport system protein FeoA
MNLADLPIGQLVTVAGVSGEGSFRRRLMELGLVPGTRVELVSVAPLGDPLELLVRGSSLSIRRSEARGVHVLSATDARPVDEGAAAPAQAVASAGLSHSGS